MKFLEAILLAVVFGAVAGVTFAFVLPYVRPDTDEAIRESVKIPRDELLDASEKNMSGDTKETVESESTLEPGNNPAVIEPTSSMETRIEEESTPSFEEMLEEALQEHRLTIEDYVVLYSELYKVVTVVNQSIVTVTSSQNNVDWFNNAFESSEETSGLIYNKTEDELLIMTDADSIHNADDNGRHYFYGESSRNSLNYRLKICPLLVKHLVYPDTHQTL